MADLTGVQWVCLGLLLASVLLTTIVMAFCRGSDDLDD